MVDKKKRKKEKEKLENDRERPKEGFVRESSGIYISDDELISLMEERVPRIIRDKPYLKDRFRELFSDVFVERRDIDKVLEEMRMEREASETRFRKTMEKMDKDREEANRKFEESDRKFREMMEKMDRDREEDRKRWEERMEKWEKEKEEDRKRWEEMREDTNRRFEEMREDTNRRFEALTLEIKQLREDTNRRFEEMREDTNKRFEAVDRRFEALTLEIKQLREDTNRRFEEMREDTNKRFEAVDRRFEALTLEIKQLREDTNKRFEAVDRRFEEMFGELKRMREDLHRSISSIGSRWGVAAENTFRNALKEVLTEIGLNVEKWQKVDEECKMFSYPRMVEIDIVIKDGKTYAIEIKSSLSENDVENFDRCVKFYEMVEVRKVDEKIILAVYAPEKSLECAKHFGIKVISELEEIKEVI